MAKSNEMFLTFILRDENYALAVTETQEIIECDRVTSVPGQPSGFHGLVHQRGRLITVLNLISGEQGYRQVIALSHKNRHLGLWVPSKITTRSLDLLKLEAQEDRPEYLKGFIEHDGTLYNILTSEGLVAHFNQVLLHHLRGAS